MFKIGPTGEQFGISSLLFGLVYYYNYLSSILWNLVFGKPLIKYTLVISSLRTKLCIILDTDFKRFATPHRLNCFSCLSLLVPREKIQSCQMVLTYLIGLLGYPNTLDMTSGAHGWCHMWFRCLPIFTLYALCGYFLALQTVSLKNKYFSVEHSQHSAFNSLNDLHHCAIVLMMVTSLSTHISILPFPIKVITGININLESIKGITITFMAINLPKLIIDFKFRSNNKQLP